MGAFTQAQVMLCSVSSEAVMGMLNRAQVSWLLTGRQ